MRILCAVPHFFDPLGSRRYGSLRPQRNQRREAVQRCLLSLRNLSNGGSHHVDIAVCTSGDRHLLSDLPSALRFRQIVTEGPPMRLGFLCHDVLRQHLGQYDFYCFVEDDLIVNDSEFVSKIAWFSRTFGDRALLQPNRFEGAVSGGTAKTYVDPELPRRVTQDWQDLDHQAELVARRSGAQLRFARPTNPHSGCFFLNHSQMKTWAAQSYFLDGNEAFVGPLESAASLGIMRAFRVYKPARPNADFLEIEHDGNHFARLIQQCSQAETKRRFPLNVRSAERRRASRATGRRALATPQRRRRFVPAVESLEQRTLLAADLNLVGGGLRDGLIGLQTALNEQVWHASAPLVGDGLSEEDSPGQIMADLADKMGSFFNGANTTESVSAAITNAFGVIPEVTGMDGDDVIKFDVTVTHTLTGAVDFDLGLPALDFLLDGQVNATVTAEIDITFGVNESTFFFDTIPNPEMTIEVDVEPPSTAEGSIAFLIFEATNENTISSLTYFVDVMAAENTLTDFSSIDVQTGVNGTSKIKYALEARFPGDDVSPKIMSDLNIEWGFDGSDPESSFFGDQPIVEFNEVALDLGTFFSGFAYPIIDQLQNILSPLKPAINGLNTEFDFLKKLGIGGDKPNLANLIGGPKVASFVGAIDTILKVEKSPVGSVLIPLGSFTTVDPRDEATIIQIENSVFVEDTLGLAQAANEKSAAFFKATQQDIDGGGLRFPLLESPAEAFKLFLGQEATFFTFVSPTLEGGWTASGSIPIPGFPLLSVDLGGSISVGGRLAFGYDTKGIEQVLAGNGFASVIDGLFAIDSQNADGTGPDVREFFVEGSVTAAITAGAAGVEVSGGGGVTASVDFNLKDLDNDRKVRVDEVLANLRGGVSCIFDITGSVTAKLFGTAKVGVEIFGVTVGGSKSFTIPFDPLLEFTKSCEEPVFPPPVLAEVTDGILELNAGFRAPLRERGNISDGAEVFEIRPGDRDDTVIVSAFGFDQRFRNVSRIEADMGEGNDLLVVRKGVKIANMDLRGDEGDDVLIYGGSQFDIEGEDGMTPVVHLRGGPGDDDLTTTTLAARLSGEEGNDTIQGGMGDDTLEGGAGNDVITGDVGNDLITGGAGDDLIDGDFGRDTIEGGDGDDDINGNLDADSILGGEGDDTIQGDIGPDTLFGGGGNDVLMGQENNDSIIGGPGDDLLLGGDRHDVLLGGLGNDSLEGGPGADRLFGEGDRDLLVAVPSVEDIDTGRDTLDGGLADDTLVGTLATDPLLMIGGEQDDLLLGSFFNDTLEGGAGQDFLFGGAGADSFLGGPGADAFLDADLQEGGDGDTILDNKTKINLFLTASPRRVAVDDRLRHRAVVANVGEDFVTDLTLTVTPIEGEIELVEETVELGFPPSMTLPPGIPTPRLFEPGDDHRFDSWQNQTGLVTGFGTTGLIQVGAAASSPLLAADEEQLVVTEVVLVSGSGETQATLSDGSLSITLTADADAFVGTALFLPTDAQGRPSFTGMNEAGLCGGPQPLGVDESRSDNEPPLTFKLGKITCKLSPTEAPEEFDLYANVEDLESISVIGVGDGANTIEVQGVFPDLTSSFLNGGPGADNIIGSAIGDMILGGDGPDEINGNQGGDTIFGGPGDDEISSDGNHTTPQPPHHVEGGPGNDTINGGRGADMLIGGEGNDEISDGDLSNTGPSNDTLLGNEGDDTLFGTLGDDLIDGNVGNDRIGGFLGDDTLLGGDGNDTLIGDTGNDSLVGGDGNDYLDGSTPGVLLSEDGIDTLDGGAGDDTLIDMGPPPNGSVPQNILLAGPGDDSIEGVGMLSGGDGIDRIEGVGTLTGGAGDDQLEGIGTLDGGEGNDTLLGRIQSNTTSEDVTLIGGPGNDTLTLHFFETPTGSVEISGGAGDDRIETRGGADTVDGGADQDELVVFNQATITLSDAGLMKDGATGPVTNFELIQLFGTTVDASGYSGDLTIGGSTVLGGSGQDFIFGQGISDSLHGGGGNDFMLGLGGNDTIEGGEGNDILFGQADNDVLLGGPGDDILHGNDGDDQLEGGDGNDILHGEADNDTLEGGAGNDTMFGNLGNDTLMGGDADDVLDGGEGNDELSGESGDDLLLGGVDPTGAENVDQLNGGAGNDTLEGGSHNDVIDGGANLDRVVGWIPDGVSDDQGDVVLTNSSLSIPGSGLDQLSSIEVAEIIGNDLSNVIRGENFSGELHLDGRGGADTLIGGSGQNNLRGGEGNDRFHVLALPNIRQEFTDGGGIDRLDFSAAEIGIELDLDMLGVAQTQSNSGVFVLHGQFEEFIGSEQVDTIFVDPRPVRRFVDGRSPTVAPGDQLLVNDFATVSEIALSNVQVLSFLPIDYVGIEHVETNTEDVIDPETVVRLDDDGNLVIEDATTAGHDENVSLTFDAEANELVVTAIDHTIRVETPNGFFVSANEGRLPITDVATQHVIFDLLEGDDVATLGPLPDGFTAELLGGEGDDQLDASTFTELATLAGGPGRNMLLGGPGDNTFLLGLAEDDQLQDGGGQDLLDFTDAEVGIAINLDLLGSSQSLGGNRTVQLDGGPYEDAQGSTFNDVFTVGGLGVQRFIDGGVQEIDSPGDRLRFDARGGVAPVDIGNAITQTGSEPVNYFEFERVDLINVETVVDLPVGVVGSELSLDGDEVVIHADGLEILRRPLEFASPLVIQGDAGDQTLTINLGNGAPLPMLGLVFHGGGPGDFDTVQFEGGTADRSSYDFENASDGTILLDSGLITYTGLEPILDRVTVVDRLFSFPDTSDVITLGDNDDVDDNILRISSVSSSETVDFETQTGALLVTFGDGDDRLRLDVDTDVRLDGQSGLDQLTLGDGVAGLHVTSDNRVMSIEAIDATSETAHSLVLDAAGVRNNVNAAGELVLLTSAQDSVDFGDGWDLEGTRFDNGTFYRVLSQDGGTLLLNGPRNYQNPINRHDVNNNRLTVEPVADILRLINEVNRPTIIDPATGELPAQPTEPFLGFIDINGDGFLTPVGDVLQQINEANRNAAGEGESAPDKHVPVVEFVTVPSRRAGPDDQLAGTPESLPNVDLDLGVSWTEAAAPDPTYQSTRDRLLSSAEIDDLLEASDDLEQVLDEMLDFRS